MRQIAAFADEDTRRMMTALSADVQASLALNRALLQALSALSPSLATAAEEALDCELEDAAREAAPQRVVEYIAGARDRVGAMPDEAEKMAALERALIAAADALPDISDLEAAEIASLPRV